MEEKTPLYSTRGLIVETYDALYDAYMQKDDIAFYKEMAAQCGGPILELGSGTGRIAWPLAEAGHHVQGLEFSEAMLEVAESKRGNYPGEVGGRIKFAHGDMRDFELDETFSLAVIAFRTFQANLSESDQRSCLRCIRRHMRPGGILIIQLFDPRLEYLSPELPRKPYFEEVRHPITGNIVKVRVVDQINDPVTQTFTVRWIHEEVDGDGAIIRQEEQILNMSWIYRREMRYLFELEGYEILAEYSDFAKSPPAYGKEQIWLACIA